jgi:hypothetical protein
MTIGEIGGNAFLICVAIAFLALLISKIPGDTTR